jgi:hypothetical protein
VQFRAFLENQLELLGEGHFGRVYRVLGYRMRASPDTPLAYKEYKQDPSEGPGELHSRAMVEKAVEFRRKMAYEKPLVCDEIDRYFAWPWEIVKDFKYDGSGDLEVCGYLMPLAQEDFFWQAGRPSGRIRSLDWLAMPESFWQRNEVEAVMSDVMLADRLLLMTQLAFALAVLHEQGWVFGDLSYQSAAFALNPPRLMLLDCDETASLSDRERRQPHTPQWYPPECEGPGAQQHQDYKTDVYKLGLAIIRYLKPGRGATTTRDPERLAGVLDAPGIGLIRSALSEDRDARPAASEIYHYLKLFTDPLISPPTIEHADLITPVVWRGADGQADGRVSWRIVKAERIDIVLGGDEPQTVRTVAPADYPDGCAFTVTRPGKVTVVASNRYGRQARVLGDVTIFAISPSSLDFYKVTDPAMADSAVRPSVYAGHAFISYVREDTRQVDQLQQALQAAGVSVWRDTASLWPGEDWRVKVRRAITDDALVFIACFSQKSLQRQKSYQNEELTLAIEQLRLRRPEEPWLIPVRFDNCQIPDLDIGRGRTLRSLHFADLFSERSDEGTARLVSTILRMLERLGDQKEN